PIAGGLNAAIVAALVLVAGPTAAAAAQWGDEAAITQAPANDQVNPPLPAASPPYTDNFPDNLQIEPAIARDPVTGAFVAAAMDFRDDALCLQTGNGTMGGTSYKSGYCTGSFAYTGIDAVYLSQDGKGWSQPTETDGA